MKLILALLFAFLATWVCAEPLEAVQNTNDDKMNKALDEVLGEALNNDDDDDDSGDEDDVQNDDDDDGKLDEDDDKDDDDDDDDDNDESDVVLDVSNDDDAKKMEKKKPKCNGLQKAVGRCLWSCRIVRNKRLIGCLKWAENLCKPNQKAKMCMKKLPRCVWKACKGKREGKPGNCLNDFKKCVTRKGYEIAL